MTVVSPGPTSTYVLAGQAGIMNAVDLANADGCPDGDCVPMVRAEKHVSCDEFSRVFKF